MTETLATLLAVAALALLTAVGSRPTAGRALAAGACIALAALCRPTFLPWLAWPRWSFRGQRRKPTGRSRGLWIDISVSVFTSWRRGGVPQSFCPLGHSQPGPVWPADRLHDPRRVYVLASEQPRFLRVLADRAPGSVWDADELNRAWLAERLETPRRGTGRGSACICQGLGGDPPRTGGISSTRAWPEWGGSGRPLPHQLHPSSPGTRLARYAVGIWYWGELLLAAVGLLLLVRKQTVSTIRVPRPRDVPLRNPRSRSGAQP